MRRLSIYLIGILSFLAVVSCSPRVRVLDTDKAHSFNLTGYSTFGFGEVNVQGDSMPLPGRLRLRNNARLMQQAIARNLESKGLKQSADPALKINISLAMEEKIQTRRTNFANDGAPRYMGQYRWRWQAEEQEVGRYDMGTLSLELVDADNNTVVLKSIAEGVLPRKAEKVEYIIDEAVQKMISQGS